MKPDKTTLCLTIIAAMALMPVLASAAEGSRSERPGDAMSDPNMNQPSPHEERATDMTGGQEGIVGKYDVMAVRRGDLVDEKGRHLDQVVKNKKGETLGTIEKLLKDTKTGKIEYAVLELAETKHQLPLQWTQFKHEGDHLILNASKKDLSPATSSKDMSPEVSQYMDKINKLRSEQKPKTGGPGAPGLPMDRSDGFGSSATPPGPAPGYEGKHPSSKR